MLEGCAQRTEELPHGDPEHPNLPKATQSNIHQKQQQQRTNVQLQKVDWSKKKGGRGFTVFFFPTEDSIAKTHTHTHTTVDILAQNRWRPRATFDERYQMLSLLTFTSHTEVTAVV